MFGLCNLEGFCVYQMIKSVSKIVFLNENIFKKFDFILWQRCFVDLNESIYLFLEFFLQNNLWGRQSIKCVVFLKYLFILRMVCFFDMDNFIKRKKIIMMLIKLNLLYVVELIDFVWIKYVIKNNKI